jgi:peroxiredoxin
MMKQVAGVLLNRLTGTHVRSIIVMTNNQEVLYELQKRKGRSSP